MVGRRARAQNDMLEIESIDLGGISREWVRHGRQMPASAKEMKPAIFSLTSHDHPVVCGTMPSGRSP
jgi:hypothetical protein